MGIYLAKENGLGTINELIIAELYSVWWLGLINFVNNSVNLHPILAQNFFLPTPLLLYHTDINFKFSRF